MIENLKEKQEFLLSIGLKETSLSKLIREGYDLLNLLTFFTSGIKESRAWSCKKGSFAPDAGAKIHSDFKRGFIKVEVIDYHDFIEFKGELNCHLDLFVHDWQSSILFYSDMLPIQSWLALLFQK